MIEQVRMRNTRFLRTLTKVCSSTKIMRIMPIICSQLPLDNTSYIILMIFQIKKSQAKVVALTIANSRDYDYLHLSRAALIFMIHSVIPCFSPKRLRLLYHQNTLGTHLCGKYLFQICLMK